MSREGNKTSGLSLLLTCSFDFESICLCRRYFVSIVCAFWMVGSIWTALTAWLMIGIMSLNWRLFACMCAMPSTICFVLVLNVLPEVSLFDLIQRLDYVFI